MEKQQEKLNNLNPTTKKRQKLAIREKRNRQYDDMAKEWSNLNISEVRVEDFAEARKKELNKFIHILNNKYSSKNGFQLLPKHMRRRQMSHNPFRMPIRCRLANLDVNFKSKCKKHKKRRAYLKTSIIRRARKNNWLETHIWHSKRFIMKKLFGYTIAYKRRDKGFKASYRYSKFDSCIYDSSYFNYLIIETENKTLEVFDQIINSFTIEQFSHPEFFKSYYLNIYNPQTGRLIGPVNIILLTSGILIKFHPLMKNEIIMTFKNLPFSDKISYNNLLNTFTLIGPRSSSILFKIIKSLTFGDDRIMNEIFLTAESEVNFEKELHFAEDGKIIIVRQMKPLSNFRMNELALKRLTDIIMREQRIISDDDVLMKTSLEQSIKSCNEHYDTNALGVLKIKSKPVSECKESNFRDLEVEIPTERTVFQHRKDVNLNKLNKKVATSIRNSYRKQEIILQNKNNANQSVNMEMNLDIPVKIQTAKEYLNQSEETFFVILKENIQKLEGGKTVLYPIFSLIFPKGYSLDLLRRFVYLECRPIGISEVNYYLTDSSRLIFPDDYPSTESYREFINNKAITNIEKYCRYPASKRVNYQKLRNPFPFYASWNRIITNTQTEIEFSKFNENVEIVHDLMNKNKILKQFKLQNIDNPIKKTFLVPIYIEMISQGIPEYNSLICLPTEEDCKIYKEKLQNKFFRNKNYISKILNNKELLHKMMRNYGNDKVKILEPVLRTEIKNKLFNLEYKTIRGLKDDLNYSSDILNKDFTVKLHENQITRRIIGFVTSGEFSYHQSKGIAKGFVLLESYENLVQLKEEIALQELVVLIRNTNSQLYHHARINLTTL